MSALREVLAAHARTPNPFTAEVCRCGWMDKRGAHAAHVEAAVLAWIGERIDETQREMFGWCGPYGYPGVADFIDRRDAHLRAALTGAQDADERAGASERGPVVTQDGAQEAARGQTEPAHVRDGKGAYRGAEGFEGTR